MRRTFLALSLLVLGAGAQLGCHNNTEPPPYAPIPPRAGGEPRRESDWDKPLPNDDYDESAAYAPGYNDPPLVIQRPPEQRAFVDAYHAVGKPKIVVFVNRTLEGEIIPVNDPPVRSNSKSDAYLRPGEYDEISAEKIDYEAIENVLTDLIAADGQVTVMSPTLVRQRLTEQQIKNLQGGQPVMLREIAQQLDADILVQVQSRPTLQTQDGLGIRVLIEAMNIQGGESIARAFVDMPPPLSKTQINRFTRFLARKLMDGMTVAWVNPAGDENHQSVPPPTTAPSR